MAAGTRLGRTGSMNGICAVTSLLMIQPFAMSTSVTSGSVTPTICPALFMPLAALNPASRIQRLSQASYFPVRIQKCFEVAAYLLGPYHLAAIVDGVPVAFVGSGTDIGY